jgi:hypothetical protein
MAQQWAEGLCFNCDEKFVQGHHCKKPFVIEIADSEEEEDVDEEIECVALTGRVVVWEFPCTPPRASA